MALGSFVAGTMATFINLLLLLAFGLIGSGLFYLMMPLTMALPITITTSTMAGVMQGISYAGSNMLILKLWAADCPPFLQAVHLSYGVGAFLSPLWVKFFLLMEPDLHFMEASENDFPEGGGHSPASTPYTQSQWSSLQGQWSNATTMATVTRTPLSKYNHLDVQLFYPFILTAVYPFMAAVLFIVLYFKYPENEVAKKPGQKGVQTASNARRGTIPKAASLPTVCESALENEDGGGDNSGSVPNNISNVPNAQGGQVRVVQNTLQVPGEVEGRPRLEPGERRTSVQIRAPERSERARRQSIVRRDSIITMRRPSMVCVQLYQPEIPHMDTAPAYLKVIFVAATAVMGMVYGGVRTSGGNVHSGLRGQVRPQTGQTDRSHGIQPVLGVHHTFSRSGHPWRLLHRSHEHALDRFRERGPGLDRSLLLAHPSTPSTCTGSHART